VSDTINWEKEYNDLLEGVRTTLSALCRDYRKREPEKGCNYPMCPLCQSLKNK
jgi:hypothetical protein